MQSTQNEYAGESLVKCVLYVKASRECVLPHMYETSECPDINSSPPSTAYMRQ